MRKEFEKLPEIARLIEKRNMIFNEEISHYGALGYADDLSLIDDIGFVGGAWYAWQAKAQAVPEGSVLMPKEPTKDTLIEIASVCIGDDFANLDEAKELYKAVIKAQEQNQ